MIVTFKPPSKTNLKMGLSIRTALKVYGNCCSIKVKKSRNKVWHRDIFAGPPVRLDEQMKTKVFLIDLICDNISNSKQ